MSEPEFFSVEQAQLEVEINREVELKKIDDAIETMIENSRLFEFSVVISDQPPRCLKKK